jgi:transcription elongation factor Elf1
MNNERTKRAMSEEKKEPQETDSPHGITCPYCGYVDRNSKERGLDDGGEEEAIDCRKCEREFMASMDVTVTFMARPLS